MARLSFASLYRSAVALAFALPALTNALSVSNTVLVIARNADEVYTGTSGLQGYGIPYQSLIVPSGGAQLPTLNSSTTAGNFGAFFILGEVSYDYGGVFRSALSDDQWNQMYAYQEAFGARMVRLDVFPGPNFGASAIGGTGNSEDQPIYFTNTSAFPTANLKTGSTASVTTTGLYHYPAEITNSSLAVEIARFSAGGGFPESTAAVINNFGKRQQMVWFLPFATFWSQTSNFLQHAHIHWATRGLYGGFRRIYFNTQVDDMFLSTELYLPQGQEYRCTVADMEGHKAWLPSINAKMPAGSSYLPEIGHNGNGDIEAALGVDSTSKCVPSEAIEYPEQIDDPNLEFQKPLGSGADIWPATPTSYAWSLACAQLDSLEQWWATPANRDEFMHVSHTFSHMGLNNATYSDTNKEIAFNIAWFCQIGLASAKHFSGNGLIPPAITGLHNGDAIKAWMDNGIKYVVGDNTRPVLRNKNTFHPLITNVANNGYDGLTIVPRWATTIYYNCDTPECTTEEWIKTSNGSGTFQDLMTQGRAQNGRNLLALQWDPFMFHQANMRFADMASTVVNGASQKLSLLQIWVETMVNEMTRLVDWPMVTLKHDDLAIAFVNRATLDACNPQVTWTLSDDAKTVTGATLSTNNNQCGTKVPITFPGPVADQKGGTAEQRGNDPLTVWITMSGQPVSFSLSTPVAI